MYNRYDIYMKQGVRDEAAYIKTGLEEDGDVFLSDRVGDATSSRITLLGKDGQVLFDSIENPEEMENHSNRPEFIEAEKQGSGEMVRYSDTLSKQTFYYAVKLKDDQVLRVARTTDSLLVTMLTSFLLLGGLVCVILVIELFLVQKQTRKLIEPINRIDLEHPLEHVCYEELRPLLFRLDQQNRQIQKQLEDLKNAESARKEFTANVSHELKTPLMSISGYAELMMNGMVPPDKMQDFSGRIFHESERLSNLVADIIQLSRLDEENGEIFDIEPDQNDGKEEIVSLPRRVRFYHAKIDAGNLTAGDTYGSLRNVIVIFITTYDPFGLNRMVYTIKNCCIEVPELEYEDGAQTIFLYTRGREGNPPEELKQLLHYMEHSSIENASTENLKKLHRMVTAVKRDGEVGLAYMKSFEREERIRRQGEEEGRKAGLEEGLEEGIIKLSRKLGKEDTEILSFLQEELQIDEEQAKLILEKYQQ